MARLRIRVELSRGGQGVPLHKLAHVIDEALKFFQMLGEDAGIRALDGEWLGVDFDRESLNFTAEYVGPVTQSQVEAFHAGFAGTTSLRRATIAQFAKITETIGEEELVGFGLYQSDGVEEPTEWRCISRRDALRMTEEIDLLDGAGEEVVHDSHLPAVQDQALAARFFGERRDRSLEHAKWVDYVRDVETTLSTRLTNVENAVQKHTEMLDDIHARTASAEESFRHLLAAVENFCTQATRQIERLPQAALPAAPLAPEPAALRQHSWSRPGPALAAGCVLGIALASLWVWLSPPSGSAAPQSASASSKTVPPAAGKQTAPAPARVVPAPAALPAVSTNVARAPTTKAVPSPAPSTAVNGAASAGSGSKMQLELEATEPTWTALSDASGNRLMAQLLVPGAPKSLELQTAATLRVGNAGGIVVRLNGKAIGPVGPHGGVRVIEFKNGNFQILAAGVPAAK